MKRPIRDPLSDPMELDHWISALALCCHESEGEEREFYGYWLWVLESELAYHAADSE